MSKKRKKKGRNLDKKSRYAKFSKVSESPPKLESPKIDKEQKEEAERSLRESMRYYRMSSDKREKVRRK